MTQKTHEIVVKVRFDKPCNRSTAVRAAKECIFGEHYPNQSWMRDDLPDVMKIKCVKSQFSKND